MQCSELLVLTDTTLILVLGCFLSALCMVRTAIKDGDPEYVTPLHDPREIWDAYVTMPKVFNKPVVSPEDRLEELGMEALSPSLPIQNHLADLLQCLVEDYQALLNGWMIQYSSDLHMIKKWLAVHGLSIQEYSMHLLANGSSDSLELWMASMAMNIPINVVIEDSIWSTARDGVELAYTLLLLTTYNDAILCCEVPDQDLSHEGAASPSLQSPLLTQ